MKGNEKINLTREEKALIETIAELPRDKHGEIMMKTIAKRLGDKIARKYTSRKVAKLLDEIGKKILYIRDIGFARRVRRNKGAYLCVSTKALADVREFMEDE